MSGNPGQSNKGPPPRLGPTLLPPGGGLAPPGNSNGGLQQTGNATGADPLLQELGAGLARASATSRVLASRAMGTAVEHAPELQRRAAAAANVAGEQARLALQRAAVASQSARAKWDATASQPARRQRLVLAGGAATVVLVAIIWFIAQVHATSLARSKVPLMLAQAGLAGSLSYGSISATPFGTVTLDHVGLRSNRLFVPAEWVRLDRYDLGPDGLRDFSMNVHQAAVPMSALRDIIPPPLSRILAGLGVVTPKLDIRIGLSGSDGPGTLLISSNIRSSEIGSFSVRVHLNGVDTARLGSVAALMAAQRGNASMAFEMENSRALQASLLSLMTLAIQAGEVEIDDSPLMSRAQGVPETPTPSDTTNNSGKAMIENIARSAANVVPPNRSDAVRQIVSDWLNKGGHITVKVAPPVPVTLFRTGEFGNPLEPTWDDPNTAAQLNIDVVE